MLSCCRLTRGERLAYWPEFAISHPQMRRHMAAEQERVGDGDNNEPPRSANDLADVVLFLEAFLALGYRPSDTLLTALLPSLTRHLQQPGASSSEVASRLLTVFDALQFQPGTCGGVFTHGMPSLACQAMRQSKCTFEHAGEALTRLLVEASTLSGSGAV